MSAPTPAKPRAAPPYVAGFDSSAAMLRALGQYLRGEDFPGLGMLPPAAAPLASVVNHLPGALKDSLYSWSGWAEATPSRRLDQVSAEDVSRWMVSEYPRARYPAVVIGSSNGAAMHLCAALAVPWLPQTFLVPVRHQEWPPDDPQTRLDWSHGPARALLKANPEVKLHHMHDPNQDRLMVRRMSYFRLKRLRLGETFTRFIQEMLPPGGTIFLVECNLQWPTTGVSDRHVFQFGALGGASPEEFMEGGHRVEEYLERYGSHRRRWRPPPPDAWRPEAEWGFEPTLLEDVQALARRRGYRVQRIMFDQPEDLSPLVTDLYRWWYYQRQLHPNRLLAESFIVQEPWWTLRTGSSPYWMVFNTEPSARRLVTYLGSVPPYDYINLTLFSHGVEGVGVASVAQWRSLLGMARRKGDFIGVDRRAFPRDFAVFVRYWKDLKKIPARYPMPGPMALDQLQEFLDQRGQEYQVQWADL